MGKEKGIENIAEYIEREALLLHIKELPTWWANGRRYNV